MSYADGIAAINLEMPPRVPRTEYSVTAHWELLTAVTGVEVTQDSGNDIKKQAAAAFMKAWNFDFLWNTLIGGQVFKKLRTNMGHANYAAGGVDFDDKLDCPFKDASDVLNFDLYETYGERDKDSLVRDFNDHYRASREYYPDAVAMTGVYVTCMSGLIDIFGWDMLLTAAGEDPEAFGALADRYADWMMQYYNALAESDAPVVMVHDDIVWTEGAFIHPDWYRRFIFPNYRKYFRPLLERGKKIIFTSDGNYTEFIDDIARCGVHGFVLEPTTDMGYIAERYGKTHAFIGNADTRVLLGGDKNEIRAEVKRCMDIGKRCPGFFMSVGNHIPANTPVGAAIYYNEVYEELGRR